MIDAQTSFMSNKSRFSLKNEYTFRHVHLREISIGYATRSEWNLSLKTHPINGDEQKKRHDELHNY